MSPRRDPGRPDRFMAWSPLPSLWRPVANGWDSALAPLPRDARPVEMSPLADKVPEAPMPEGRECVACQTPLSKWNQGTICGGCEVATRDLWPPPFYEGEESPEETWTSNPYRAKVYQEQKAR